MFIEDVKEWLQIAGEIIGYIIAIILTGVIMFNMISYGVISNDIKNYDYFVEETIKSYNLSDSNKGDIIQEVKEKNVNTEQRKIINKKFFWGLFMPNGIEELESIDLNQFE